ncbi:MAG: M48 family metallopeptidase [Ignavibacteria bacterium]|nr:M48 family metallopeptidase [Ignavibacteria bacterium]
MPATPRNIYEQQAANKRKTFLVMVLFVLFLGFLGFGFDTFFLQAAVPLGTVMALIIGAGSAVWSLNSGAQAVLNSSGARRVPVDDPRYQQLRNIVEEMAIASGQPVPLLYVIPDHDPNAFATGKNPEHAAIAVTEGLMEKLNREELQGVIAHEMGHVRNLDIRLMTVVAALVGSVMLLSEFGARSMMYGGGRRRSSDRDSRGGGPVLLVLWIIALVLAPLVSRLLAMAVSRQREYLADASAAELTRNPLALASALSKIDSAAEPTRSIKKGVAHLCIADPLGRKLNAREGALAELFATHPPIEKRITILRAMAYQQAPARSL